MREVKRHAFVDLGLEEGNYPHPATVYRILKPLIECEKRKKKIRNPGAGSWLSVVTHDGKLLKAEFSNQIVQCDHIKLDIRIIYDGGKVMQWRPWLTTVIDTFSSCLIGYHLWHKQPGAHEVALTLRHAAFRKEYPSEYELEKSWDVCGLPFQYFFTDRGKDLSKSKLIKAIGKELGFQCELREKPPEGGIVERLFKTINTQVLDSLPGYQPNRARKEQIEKAEKDACLTLEDLDKILAGYFCDDYNHQPYPKDPSETRFERWFRGMGNQLPEPINERDLDLCLLKEEQRTVQANGSVYFGNLTYRCEELRSHQGEYVTLRYDPDNILTMYVYSLGTGDDAGEFIGYAHAINMDTQNLSLDELKQLNKDRSKAKREHSNYDALLSLDKRQKLVNKRKQEKKERQRAEQKKLREKSKKNSKVVEIRAARGAKSAQETKPMELLPARISPEQAREQTQPKPLNSQPTFSQPAVPAESAAVAGQSPESQSSTPQAEERHQLVIPKNKTLKRIW